jgi:hypothetical protein
VCGEGWTTKDKKVEEKRMLWNTRICRIKIENKDTHPMLGKNKWLSLFSAVDASSVPRDERMKGSVVLNRAFLSSLYMLEGRPSR